MRKILIYTLVAFLVLGGFFYLTLDKDKGKDTPPPVEEDQNQTESPDKEEPEDKNPGNLEEYPDEIEEEEKKDQASEGPRIEEREIELGKRLPDFSLKDLKGDLRTLSDYEKEGKIIFLNFWASWCPPCREEMPDLEKLDKEFDDVKVVAVNVEEKRDRDKVEKFLSEGDYNFDILLDDEMEVGMEYFISSFPSTFFIDKNGIFRGLWPGMLTYEQMVDVVEDLRQY